MFLIERFITGGGGAAVLPGPWRARARRVALQRDDVGAMAFRAEHGKRRLERLDDATLLELTPRVPEAFGVFFARHQAAVVSYLARQTGNREVAAEVAAEAFAVVFESVDRYDASRGDARGWLFGVARITMLASFRNQRAEDAARRRLGITVAGHSDEAWEDVEARMDAALSDLLAGVESLPRAERNAVLARVVEERDYADIADSEDASEAAIRQRVRRGLSRLRTSVEGGR